MAYEVPTKDDVKDTAVSGGISGTGLALGETVGRGILGPGLGTAAGGVLAASAMDDGKDMAAMVAVERGMTELFARAGGSSRAGQQGVK